MEGQSSLKSRHGECQRQHQVVEPIHQRAEIAIETEQNHPRILSYTFPWRCKTLCRLVRQVCHILQMRRVGFGRLTSVHLLCAWFLVQLSGPTDEACRGFGEFQRPAFEETSPGFPHLWGSVVVLDPLVKRNSGDDEPTRARLFRGTGCVHCPLSTVHFVEFSLSPLLLRGYQG